jgi:hypothetical protein
VSTDVSEKHVASIFGVGEYAKKETSMKQVANRAATYFTLGSCLAYSLTLKMEATCSSGTSVDFQQTTPHYIPEDTIFHSHCCENLKSYIN